MPVGSTRYFEASFTIFEWLLEDRRDDLSDEQIEALYICHETLREVSNDIWDEEPPKLPQKVGDVPLHPEYDEEYFRENF